jgi:hypothetical protein
MIPRRFRVPAIVLAAAALFAGLLPNMVRASGPHAGITTTHASMVRLARAVAHLERVHGALSVRSLGTAHQGRFGSHVHTLFRRNDLAPANVASLAVPLATGQSVIPANSDNITGTIFTEHHAVVGDLSQLDIQSNTGTSQFAIYHPAPHSYVQSNVEAALLQNWSVQVQLPAYPTFVKVNYLATVYASQADAVASGDWALSTITSQLGLTYEQPCTRAQAPISTVSWQLAVNNFLDNPNTSCTVTVWHHSPDINGEVNDEIYTVADYGNVLEEVDYNIRDSDLQNSSLSDIQQKQLLAADATATANISADVEATVENAVDNGGGTPPPPATPTSTSGGAPPPPTATPTPRPTATPRPTNTPVAQPEVKLDAIAIATEGKDKKLHTAKGLKSAQAGYFLAQFDVTNIGANTPSAQITYSYKGKTIATDQMQQVPSTLDTRSLAGFRSDQAAQTYTYYDVFGLKKVKKAISLKATVDVTVGSSHDSGSISFKVKTNCTTKKGKKTCK